MELQEPCGKHLLIKVSIPAQLGVVLNAEKIFRIFYQDLLIKVIDAET